MAPEQKYITKVTIGLMMYINSKFTRGFSVKICDSFCYIVDAIFDFTQNIKIMQSKMVFQIL